MQELTQDRVRELFDYAEGKLIWKARRSHVKAGSVAGTNHRTGYIQILLDRKAYLAHRLVFLYHHGYLPDYVDHIDGDRKNNRIENLRQATFAQNIQNKGMTARNTSGFKGVSWRRDLNTWHAQIYAGGKKLHLGLFDDPKEAAQAYAEAAKRYHGEFART